MKFLRIYGIILYNKLCNRFCWNHPQRTLSASLLHHFSKNEQRRIFLHCSSFLYKNHFLSFRNRSLIHTFTTIYFSTTSHILPYPIWSIHILLSWMCKEVLHTLHVSLKSFLLLSVPILHPLHCIPLSSLFHP